jgi:hypothetical protein
MVRLSGPSGWADRSSTKLPTELLIGAGFAVGGFAAVAGDVLATLATAVIGWLFLNGLLVDQHAMLRWHGTAMSCGWGALRWRERRARGWPRPVAHLRRPAGPQGACHGGTRPCLPRSWCRPARGAA